MCTGYLRSSISASRVKSIANNEDQTEMYLTHIYIDFRYAGSDHCFKIDVSNELYFS